MVAEVSIQYGYKGPSPAWASGLRTAGVSHVALAGVLRHQAVASWVEKERGSSYALRHPCLHPQSQQSSGSEQFACWALVRLEGRRGHWDMAPELGAWRGARRGCLY